MDITYYATFDLPVPYKDLKIYPAKVKEYMFFNLYSQCLIVDKNSIPDPAIITMTELEYLFYATQQDFDKTPYLLWLDRLLSLVLKDDATFASVENSMMRYNYDEKGKPFFTIGETKYNSDDYKTIKSIICQQNLVELPDESISKEVRDSLEKAKEYKNKISGTKTASFEDYMLSLSVATGWKLEYIYEMSVRKFIKAVRRMDNLIHYKIYLASSMSGMVEFKDKSFIKHWLTDIEDKDKYSDVSVGLDEMKDKISLNGSK